MGGVKAWALALAQDRTFLVLTILALFGWIGVALT